MKKLFLVLLCLLSLEAKAQTPEMFEPVHASSLRLPCVPLLTVDPYFSYWCKYDHLYEGNVTHWSGVKKPLNGVLRVDGATYRFMGSSMESVFPFATEKAWTGKYVTAKPSGDWTNTGYDDSSWSEGAAPWGGDDDAYNKTVKTSWTGANTNIWVRRTITLDSIQSDATYYIMYKHDDTFELYLNGEQVASTGYTWDVSGGKFVKLDSSKLKVGENVIACHCLNTTGGAYVDMGLYLSKLDEANQKSVTVMPTNTYYTIQCGGVDLRLVFTAPQVMSDLVLFSTPINYITYEVKSNDGQEHDVQLFLESSAEMAVRNDAEATITRRKASPNLEYLYAGNASQSVLSQTGDLIDWGYFYMSNDKKTGHKLLLGKHDDLLGQFIASGVCSSSINTKTCTAGTYYSMVYNDSIGTVGTEGKRNFTMLGYDDVYSIQYFSNNRKAYWANNGKTTIQSRFEDLYLNYDSIMDLCRQMDETIYTDGYNAGGQKYAEILCASYRQANAAHKLFKDSKGNLMFMSRENNSGGFINTLDVTYPSQPLYWIYNPALAKAMITPVFEYSALGKWNYDFPNHDLGHYPVANGNHYGNPADGTGSTMPVEQSGNMLTLTAIIATMDNDIEYLTKYWSYMTKWANYLVENGKDPANQLCTDDFMGHSARNINLAAKAIMGVMSYSEMARMQGLDSIADEYKAKAQDMADYWLKTGYTTTGSAHYLLNFGADGSTWSTKYNLVWDKIWGWDMFKTARARELSFYTGKFKTYGLPLDSRGNLCKTDWEMWVGALSASKTAFQRYVNPLWKFLNETTSRVPFTDNIYCNSGTQGMFQARSVVGGHWMKVFMDKYLAGELTGIRTVPAGANDDTSSTSLFDNQWYDLFGRKTSTPRTGQIYIHDGKKVMK